MAGSKSLRPQPGYQVAFLKSAADITIGGGAAGAGKTFSLLLDMLYNAENPNYSAVFFRRTTPELTAIGGAWETAMDLYSRTVGGTPNLSSMTWTFPRKGTGTKFCKIKFGHLQYDQDKETHKSAQYPVIYFDELTTFLESQFWFLMSRNRAADAGVRPYVKATTNPQSNGWVKRLISWWLYPDNYEDSTKAGYPIPERDGKIRWFYRLDQDTMIWGDSREEVFAKVHRISDNDPKLIWDMTKSLTFIHGSIFGNLELMKNNPQYLGNLQSMGDQERSQLLDGNWRVVDDADILFGYASLMDMREADYVAAGKGPNEHYITADIALEGSDLFVVGVWSGWRLIHVETRTKTDGPQILKIIQDLARQYRVPRSNIAFDRDGVGDALTGFLAGAYGLRSQSVPMAEKEENTKTPAYENLRAQLVFRTQKMVGRGMVYVAPSVSEFHFDKITEELRTFRKKQTTAGKLAVSRKDEIKARLGHSPDYADMFWMRAIFDMKPKVRAATTAVM